MADKSRSGDLQSRHVNPDAAKLALGHYLQLIGLVRLQCTPNTGLGY